MIAVSLFMILFGSCCISISDMLYKGGSKVAFSIFLIIGCNSIAVAIFISFKEIVCGALVVFVVATLVVGIIHIVDSLE